jgi:hypothetical protein
MSLVLMRIAHVTHARWLMYFEKVKTAGGLFVYDTSEVNPLAMLLLGEWVGG